MTRTETEPLSQNWTNDGDHETHLRPTRATAFDVNGCLARLEVADIDPMLVPHLAAAAAELGLLSGVPWRFSTDDPPVALMRMIAKVTMRHPDVGGPHTARLLDLLRRSVRW